MLGFDHEMIRFLFLSQCVVIAMGMVALKVFKADNVFVGAVLPAWIVSLSKILKEPHTNADVFFLLLVVVYFHQYITIFFLWLLGGYEIFYYKFMFLPAFCELVGMDSRYNFSFLGVSYSFPTGNAFHIFMWYVVFNVLARLALKTMCVSDKAEIIRENLMRENGWWEKDEVTKAKRPLFSVKNLKFDLVRLKPAFMVNSSTVVDMHGQFEIACNATILSIVPQADEKNDFDFYFGELDTKEEIDEKTQKKVTRSAVTWAKMPQPGSQYLIPMGMSGGELIAHNYAVYPTWFIAGKPRSGKSVQVLAMLRGLARSTNNFQLILMEFNKGCIDYEWLLYDADEYKAIEHLRGTSGWQDAKMRLRRNHNVIAVGDVDKFERTVEMLDAEADYRRQYLASKGVQSMLELPDNERLPLLLVVYDEILTAKLKYEVALKDQQFIKAMNSLQALYLSGGYVGILNVGVYHEVTKDTVGKTRDSGLIYAFNAERHETDHIVKQRVETQFGQGIGICRDISAQSVVRKYCVPYTSSIMAQQAVTESARKADDSTVRNNLARQLLLSAEVSQIQLYSELGEMRKKALRNSALL